MKQAIKFRGEMMQGQAGLLKVVMIGGVEVAVCYRRHKAGRWALHTLPNNAGDVMTLVDGLGAGDLVAAVEDHFGDLVFGGGR